MLKRLFFVLNHKFPPKLLYPALLLVVIIGVYHQLFLFGKIPFPGDLMVASYSPWLSYYKIPVHNPLISDIFSQFFIWKYMAIDIIKDGNWPLWNPYSFTGTPLLATYHSAVLNPFNLFLFLPRYSGWGIYIFSQTLISAFTMYLLLSYWLKDKLASFAGSIIFSLAGLMTTWLEFGTAVYAVAWLPLSLYCITRFAALPKIRYILLLIISLSLTVLAGNAQIATYTYIIVPLFATVVFWGEGSHKFIMKLLPVILAIIISLTIATPVLLPSAELLQKSIRQNDTYIQQNNFGLLPWGEIIKLFIADFFGNPTTGNYWGFLNYSETSLFVGSMTLPLFIFSLIFLKRNKISYFFLALFGLSLTFAFKNPLSEIIYKTQIPLLTSSFASRTLFLTTFSFSIISAFSLNQILTRPDQESSFFKVILWSVAVFIGVIIGISICQIILKVQISHAATEFYKGIYTASSDVPLKNIHVALKNSFLPLMLSSMLLVTFLFLKSIKHNFIVSRRIYLVSIILTILLTLELGRYFIKFNPFVSQQLVYPQTPTISYLQEQPGQFRIGREHAEVLPPNTWAFYKLQSFERYDPLYLSRYGQFMQLLNGAGFQNGTTGRYAELSTNYSSPYLDMANVKYFIVILRDKNGIIPGDLINYKFKDAGYRTVYKDKSSAILENKDSLNRAYFAPSILETSSEQAEKIMSDPQFDPRKTVLIPSNFAAKATLGKGDVQITKYTPNEVNLKTQTDYDEVLVLLDQFEEGWKVEVDSKEVPIARANLIFRAVQLTPGSHQIKFYYWPSSFDHGLKIFIITACLIIIFFFYSLKRKIF